MSPDKMSYYQIADRYVSDHPVGIAIFIGGETVEAIIEALHQVAYDLELSREAVDSQNHYGVTGLFGSCSTMFDITKG
jgi:hypothetical protein